MCRVLAIHTSHLGLAQTVKLQLTKDCIVGRIDKTWLQDTRVAVNALQQAYTIIYNINLLGIIKLRMATVRARIDKYGIRELQNDGKWIQDQPLNCKS